MNKFFISILVAFSSTTFSYAMDYQEAVPMLYYKVALGKNFQPVKNQQRVGFSVNYQVTEDGFIPYQSPPLLDISHSGDRHTVISFNGIRVLNNNNRLHQGECEGENCSGTPGLGFAIGAGLVVGYLVLESWSEDIGQAAEDLNNTLNEGFR